MKTHFGSHRLPPVMSPVVLLVSSWMTAGTAPAQALDLRVDRVFKLFEVWKLPAVLNRPFVEVSTGNWVWNRGKQRNTSTHGFLLADEKKRFRVLTVDLRSKWYYRTPRATKAHAAVGYIAKPLKVRVRELAKSLARLCVAEGKVTQTLGEAPVHHTITLEGLFVAWQCRKRDILPSARVLTRSVLEVDGSPYQRIREELRRTHQWHLVAGIGDPRLSWKDHLERYTLFSKRFPTGGQARWNKHAIRVLRRMIADERRRSRRYSEDSAIDQLIHDLRTQCGAEAETLGSCDIFLDPRGEKSPAHRLEKLGYAAVPSLIEALADDSFTRSVGISLQLEITKCPRRVSDCARAVLERIAHRTFEDRPWGPRLEIASWWREIQTKGEKQALIDAVKRGDDHAYPQALFLIEKYPDAAAGALSDGIHDAQNKSVAARLTGLLQKLRREKK